LSRSIATSSGFSIASLRGSRIIEPQVGLNRVVLSAQAVAAGLLAKRNGQYRHGERTKAAIAEQRRFGALLKMLRDGLT
jgi:hypothetical protein